MALTSEGFTFYISYKEQIDMLESSEMRLKAYEIITNYGCYLTLPDIDSLPYELKLLFLGWEKSIYKNLSNRGVFKKKENP